MEKEYTLITTAEHLQDMKYVSCSETNLKETLDKIVKDFKNKSGEKAVARCFNNIEYICNYEDIDSNVDEKYPYSTNQRRVLVGIPVSNPYAKTEIIVHYMIAICEKDYLKGVC